MNIEENIKTKIHSNLFPEFIKVIDFSSQHKNHYENKNSGAVSHLSLIIVSKYFEDLNRIERERKVHQILDEEIKQHLHSLRLKLYTSKEYKLIRG